MPSDPVPQALLGFRDAIASAATSPHHNTPRHELAENQETT